MLMHGMEALAALHRISSHPTVLQRLLELLDILCTRLAREQGLLYEAYLPAAGGAQWQPAPGQVVVYGEQLLQAVVQCLVAAGAASVKFSSNCPSPTVPARLCSLLNTRSHSNDCQCHNMICCCAATVLQATTWSPPG